MMFNDFEEIKSRVPIIDFLEKENIELPKNNISKLHTIKCIFSDHNEKTKSFTIYPSSNSFYCFGCGRGGDVVIVARLLYGFNSNLEEGKYINQKFGLGLFEKNLSTKRWKEIQKQNKKRKVVKLTIGSYITWKNKTEKWFTHIFKNLWGIFINCSPKNFEEPHKAWHLAANYVERIEKILEYFKSNSREQILDNYDIINSWQYKMQKEIEVL